MKYLVDTHVLLWLLSTPDRIAAPARSALADRANALLVSVASALEISTKVRLGKLDANDLIATLGRRLADIGAEVLPITLEHALLAGSMSWAHRDPFDRLLVAQATVEDATFVTVDAAIVGIPVPRILTW
jgi:PIN domain nuclease of toxin-antitoxin system